MRTTVSTVAIVVMAGFALSAQQTTRKPAAKTGGGHQQKIRLAMSAAPPEIGRNATIVEMNEKGEATELRKGTNGWTCMPSAGGAAGVAGADPMCLDKQWMNWADAWVHKRDPKVDSVGIAYMLRGDKGASNTDPYATGPTAANQWVVAPPHVMVITPDAKLLESLPTDPQNGGPWVMWKGTKYAHVMVPTAPMPRKAGAVATSGRK
jgi:hypothetical protein